MKILLHSPVSTVRRNGNRQTSSEWATILRRAGHEVTSISSYEGESADLLIALHANKSRAAVLGFQKTVPDGKIILALTGTDIYPAPDGEAINTMERSDLIITLQRKAREVIPETLQDRVVTVIQAAPELVGHATPDPDHFDVCVVGHLRDVKDPLLTAKASRLLPASSQIRVRHAGGILDERYAALVASEEKQNFRYDWLGELSESETAHLIRSSRLMVLSSLSEGGARVVGEAISLGTPVLSTRIAGVIGLLGEDYPGLFPVGDTEALASLLTKAEEEAAFYETLRASALAHAEQFNPANEAAALLSAVERVLG